MYNYSSVIRRDRARPYSRHRQKGFIGHVGYALLGDARAIKAEDIMSQRTEKDFFDWLYGASFYHGTTRYGQFGGRHVFATKYDESEELRDLLDDLEGGDFEAIQAGIKIQKMYDNKEIWMAYNDNPAIAMTDLVNQIRFYYFNVLNK